MALAQVITGTGEEIIRYLEQRRDKQNLTLNEPQSETEQVKKGMSVPEDTVFSHGIPLLPLIEGAEAMTLEKVKQILEEDEEEEVQRAYSYPRDAERRNGVPLFPTEGREGIVTMEMVKELLEEDM